MLDWLLVARSNRYGVTRDHEILIEAIQRSGGIAGVARSRRRNFFDWLLRRRHARHLLFIERVFPMWFSAAEHHWLVPNQERFPRRHLRRLKRIGLVLAKTRHAQEIFSGLGIATTLLGFTSSDCFDGGVEKDWSRFIHVAGANTLKGTEDVLALWRAHPEWPELVLVQNEENAPRHVPRNVMLVSGFVPPEVLRHLQNRCGIHLCPSRSEGWGHYIVEGLSVGAVVVSTDAPPMNEHVTRTCGVLVAAARSAPRHLGTNFFVDLPQLESTIKELISLPASDKARIGQAARKRFEEIDAAFRARAEEVFGGGASLPRDLARPVSEQTVSQR